MAVDLTKVQAESTIGTYLFFGTSADSLTELARIKNYPDLGGAPEMLETTDLGMDVETQVPGVQSASSMDFTLNYNADVYAAVNEKANTQGYYELRFGDKEGANGIFAFEGKHTIYVNGGDVNAVREMTMSVARSSKIEKK